MRKVEVDIKPREKEKPAEREYSRVEVIDILYKNLKPVKEFTGDKVVGSSKYAQLATDYNYSNYRMCSVRDLVNLGVYSSFSGYQKSFFSENGAVVAIFNELNDKVASIVFRAVSSKAFMDYSVVYSAYGMNLMNKDFKYGDTVILTEGIYDADVLRSIYPNVLAMLTSNITLMQAEILRTLTDSFVVLFDSDEAGNTGYKTAEKRLIGCKVQYIPVFHGDKDVGQMEEVRKSGREYAYNERKEYYTEYVERLTQGYTGESIFDLG